MTVKRGKLQEPEREHALELAELLMLAFRWKLTPQGVRYWARVHENLQTLGRA